MHDGNLRGGGLWRGIVLGAAALALAVLAGREAMIQALARANPGLVLRLDPGNDRALAALYRRGLTAQGLPPDRRGLWAERARAGLRAAPLSAPLLRMVADDPAGTRRADGLFALAEQVSRRDTLLQLMLIERSARANRVDDALRHFDRALSIAPDLREALFPLMARALAAPQVVGGLAAYSGRPWMPQFLEFAVGHAASVEGVSGLLGGVGQRPDGAALVRDHEAALAARLVGQGAFAAAHRLALRAAGADAAWVDRAEISPRTWMTPGRPLTWTTAENEAVDAQIETGHSVLVTAGPGDSGLALFRVMMPAPGRWRFSARAAAPADGSSPAGGQWNLYCLHGPDRSAVALGELAVDPQHYGEHALTFDVPGDCPAVRIGFTIENSESSSPGGVVLGDIALEPAGPLQTR